MRPHVEVVAFQGEGKLSSVAIRDRQSGAQEEIHPAGVFVFVGLKPNTEWVPAEVARDAGGFITTHGMLETSVPGVFAAGDVRAGSTKQAASAAGEGATAALGVRDFLRR